jgi:oligopeptide transport system ATP-binding protein
VNEHASHSPVLEVRNLKKHFPLAGGWFSKNQGTVYAVDGIGFSIGPGETLGLVGESGCGKSTTGRCILRLIEPTEGTVLFEGEDVTRADPQRMKALRRQMQIIFQDPYGSLNPRMTVGNIVGEPLLVHRVVNGRKERMERVAELLKKVGLEEDHMQRYPHEFSGGQRQRIGIARAIALHPRLIVGDEPVSALDVSIQAQVINLLEDIQEEFGLSYLIIAHDLNVIRYISDRVAVMYLGRIVELAPAEAIYSRPRHPYTEALLSAVPVADPEKKRSRTVLPGEIPSPLNPPAGCHFKTRCPIKEGICETEYPPLRDLGGGHSVACHLR